METSGLLEYFYRFITDSRKLKFERLIENRTRFLAVVLEDIYQPHNTSAVLRSCDGFGIQDVHIIENKNKYQINPDIELGTSKWLTLNKYNKTTNNTGECIEGLRKKNYRIVVTSPHVNDCLLNDLDLNKGKIALCMGTELHGASQELLDLADEFVRIPMYGFTESFNISVSAAICFYDIITRLKKSETKWELTEKEKLDIKLDWARNTVNKPDLIEKEFLKSLKANT